METNPDRRYSIGEASRMLDIAPHLLRQWEERFPQLHPDRSPTGRRYYNARDIDIARRIKYLLRHEKLTIRGARLRLAQELHGHPRPQSRTQMLQLAEKIEEEVHAILRLLDPPDT